MQVAFVARVARVRASGRAGRGAGACAGRQCVYSGKAAGAGPRGASLLELSAGDGK